MEAHGGTSNGEYWMYKLVNPKDPNTGIDVIGPFFPRDRKERMTIYNLRYAPGWLGGYFRRLPPIVRHHIRRNVQGLTMSDAEIDTLDRAGMK